MDEKKYPWIKSVFKKKPPVTCVYAGPAVMGKFPMEPQTDDGDSPRTEKVYAGPSPDQRPQFEGVYAAPASSGIRPRPLASEMEDVYAGPEFFENGAEPDEEAEEPVSEAETESSEEAPEKAPPESVFMMVYAGPGYFSNGGGMNAFAMPAAVSGPFCERCGLPVPKEAKFCPNCGTPITKKV